MTSIFLGHGSVLPVVQQIEFDSRHELEVRNAGLLPGFSSLLFVEVEMDGGGDGGSGGEVTKTEAHLKLVYNSSSSHISPPSHP